MFSLTIAKPIGILWGMTKSPVHNITDTLTADVICGALGVSPHSVRYARTAGSFPASWYGPLKAMCDEVGIPCPLNAFNWKASAKKLGGGNAAIQGQPDQKVNSGKQVRA